MFYQFNRPSAHRIENLFSVLETVGRFCDSTYNRCFLPLLYPHYRNKYHVLLKNGFLGLTFLNTEYPDRYYYCKQVSS